ncbi:MAG TPA: hypothetical protein VJ777_13900, partial [Mycobacterium sp.]|nr:hypothetical protein [Mycobacterium sp.]
MIIAERFSAPRESVLVKGVGLFVLAERNQGVGEVKGRAEGDSMVAAELLAASDKGFFDELAGALWLTQPHQSTGDVKGRLKCVGVVVSTDTTGAGVDVLFD